MLLNDVASASQLVAATTSRRRKAELLAGVLSAAGPDDLPVLVPWLAGSLRQRRTGLGWAALRTPPPPAPDATLTVAEVDAALQAAGAAWGPGAQTARRALLADLLARATPPEQRFLAALVGGELRQGAQRGVLLEAVALATGRSSDDVRRAVSTGGDLAGVAAELLSGGPAASAGGSALQVGRPVAPMLAQSAPDVPTALARTGPAAVEEKLDGIRIQVHRDGDTVRVWSRSLDELTGRLPEVEQAAGALLARTAVLDGEVLALRPDGRPRPFQQTASRVARHAPSPADVPLTAVLFDLLHRDGDDLLGASYAARRAALEEVAPPHLLVARTLVPQVDEAGTAAAVEAAAAAAQRGHEGVVVKALAAPYAMGRRGGAWVKVKPRTTLDLVVLAAEWGSGRRTGWLSNLHLGARDPDGEYGPRGGFVMLGKTFKGLTDAMLRWQTERLQQLGTGGTSYRVDVRPELVVEIALDGVQTSRRYPAGMALRFARVVRHRPDKPAAEADVIETVRELHRRGG